MKVTNPDRNYLGTSLEGWPDSDELERILEKTSTERPRESLSLDPDSRSYLSLLLESLSERFRR
ncbi:hypothetical protein [Salinigranum sp. GCM10025319]|uniref:hypothetical protein n=1 Tax=Salinigranum sp. GCM10025319 TaxID=3252687 RepID=UPI003613A80F